MLSKLRAGKAVACVIGLGYVGMPLAQALSGSLMVIGYDIDSQKIAKLKAENQNRNLIPTCEAEDIKRADFVIICVPTPITKSKEPDLSPVKDAARITGRNIKPGSVVILESTVYPGVTEEIVKPIIESESGLVCGRDFKIAYCPERINPGDTVHTISTATKVVSGMDEETLEAVAELYQKVAPTIFKARDIKTAEAAKAIENIQRDINIALMNELSLIFARMGINTRDVLDAAATKWNFHHYLPGLVGGHCIPVDPYYLLYKAKELGYHPQVILAGRMINDNMAKYVADLTIKSLNEAGKPVKGSKILVMGLTYKEDVADIRETPVQGVIREFREFGIKVFAYDPLLEDRAGELAVELVPDIGQLSKVDGIILAVAHRVFGRVSLEDLKRITSDHPVLIDVRGFYNRIEAEAMGFYYQTL